MLGISKFIFGHIGFIGAVTKHFVEKTCNVVMLTIPMPTDFKVPTALSAVIGATAGVYLFIATLRRLKPKYYFWFGLGGVIFGALLIAALDYYRLIHYTELIRCPLIDNSEHVSVIPFIVPSSLQPYTPTGDQFAFTSCTTFDQLAEHDANGGIWLTVILLCFSIGIFWTTSSAVFLLFVQVIWHALPQTLHHGLLKIIRGVLKFDTKSLHK